jgi:hypothetical protein
MTNTPTRAAANATLIFAISGPCSAFIVVVIVSPPGSPIWRGVGCVSAMLLVMMSINSSSELPHSGNWDAWLDGYGTTHTDTLSQTVSIPMSCVTATLSFWLHAYTAETMTTTAYDTLTV